MSRRGIFITLTSLCLLTASWSVAQKKNDSKSEETKQEEAKKKEAAKRARELEKDAVKKSREQEFLRCETGGGKRGNKRRGSGNGRHGDVMSDTQCDEAMSGVRHERHSGVGHQRRAGALLELDNQLRGTGDFVVLVIADQAFPNVVMIQELLCLSRVFAGDEVHFLENPEGTQSDVFEVADRCGN